MLAVRITILTKRDMAIDKQTIDFLNYRIQALEKEVERLTKENNFFYELGWQEHLREIKIRKL